MLFQELKNFKGVLAFMLFPIIGLMMEGHVAAGIWTAVLVYLALPVFVMILDAINIESTTSTKGVARTFTFDNCPEVPHNVKVQHDLVHSINYSYLPSNLFYRHDD